ncbi:hypothetical protein SUGI_0734660 [Cryptomeria japonica]|nr:hypothetical protein SUGI_0734660 [Cryptomeria japonica]
MQLLFGLRFVEEQQSNSPLAGYVLIQKRPCKYFPTKEEMPATSLHCLFAKCGEPALTSAGKICSLYPQCEWHIQRKYPDRMCKVGELYIMRASVIILPNILEYFFCLCFISVIPLKSMKATSHSINLEDFTKLKCRSKCVHTKWHKRILKAYYYALHSKEISGATVRKRVENLMHIYPYNVGTGYPEENLHRLDSPASSVRAPPHSCLLAYVKGPRERTSPQTARHTAAGPDFPFSCGFQQIRKQLGMFHNK